MVAGNAGRQLILFADIMVISIDAQKICKDAKVVGKKKRKRLARS
jgi:hypothetical protein